MLHHHLLRKRQKSLSKIEDMMLQFAFEDTVEDMTPEVHHLTESVGIASRPSYGNTTMVMQAPE